MADRYISASERTKVLAEGLKHYATWMDSNQRVGSTLHHYWLEWQKMWGRRMVQRVEEIHERNFGWCTRYREE